MSKLQLTDPAAFVSRVGNEIAHGNCPDRMWTELRWIRWRFVRVYCATFTQRHAASLELIFGPVSERDLPNLSEGDSHVSID